MPRAISSPMRRKAALESVPIADRIQGEPLAPLRHVERVLLGPDGTAVRVRVPVYPPFQLAVPKTKTQAKRPAPARKPEHSRRARPAKRHAS